MLAAKAVWGYADASVRRTFGTATGDSRADRLVAAIQAKGREGLDGTAQHALFGRNLTARELEGLRSELERQGLIVAESIPTGGRPRIISYDVTKHTKDTKEASP